MTPRRRNLFSATKKNKQLNGQISLFSPATHLGVKGGGGGTPVQVWPLQRQGHIYTRVLASVLVLAPFQQSQLQV